MAYYDALIAEWPSISGTSPDTTAAKAAFALGAPAAPSPVPGDTNTSNAQRSAWITAIHNWHWSYASVFYDPLVAAKLVEINALTVPGPNTDVAASSIVGVLLLNNGAYLKIQALANSAATGNSVHDDAMVASQLLMIMLTDPNAPKAIQTSVPAINTEVMNWLGTLETLETAQANSTGVTANVAGQLLALTQSFLPWWSAPVSANGGGLGGPVSSADLEAVMAQSNGSIWLV